MLSILAHAVKPWKLWVLITIASIVVVVSYMTGHVHSVY